METIGILEEGVERQMQIPLENFRKGVTAPTETTLGTTPAVPGLLFDNTAEKVGLGFMNPPSYKGGDLKLYLWCLLNATETAGDTIDFTFDYVVVQNSCASYANGDGGSVTKTNSTATGSMAVVAGTADAGLQIGTLYEVHIDLDPADATNPFSADAGFVLYGDLYRTNVGGAGEAGGVVVSGAHIQYQSFQ